MLFTLIYHVRVFDTFFLSLLMVILMSFRLYSNWWKIMNGGNGIVMDLWCYISLFKLVILSISFRYLLSFFWGRNKMKSEICSVPPQSIHRRKWKFYSNIFFFTPFHFIPSIQILVWQRRSYLIKCTRTLCVYFSWQCHNLTQTELCFLYFEGVIEMHISSSFMRECGSNPILK